MHVYVCTHWTKGNPELLHCIIALTNTDCSFIIICICGPTTQTVQCTTKSTSVPPSPMLHHSPTWEQNKSSAESQKGVIEVPLRTRILKALLQFIDVPLRTTCRRALLQFKDVPLRIRRALSLYKVYGDSALLVLNRISYCCSNALLALNWQNDTTNPDTVSFLPESNCIIASYAWRTKLHLNVLTTHKIWCSGAQHL